MKFQNPNNSYTVETNHPGLWTLLFGCFYFAKHGAWAHALLSLFLAFLTAGISWLIYPFFAAEIIKKTYLRKGWVSLDKPEFGYKLLNPSAPWWQRWR